MTKLSDKIPYQAIIDRPALQLPDDAYVAVWVILNVEEWRIDRPMPRNVLSPPMGQPLIPDIANWSWHEYGMRSGFWRQYEALTQRDIPTTLAINANVCNSYPRVAQAAKECGWEFMGHGFQQGPMHWLDNQGEEIARAVDIISNFCGSQIRSWESPGLTETDKTLELLCEQGIEYIADWVIDDLPQRISISNGLITTIPYTVETNDIVVYALQGHRSDELLNRGVDQFDRLYLEGKNNARIMAISMHPYITGVPHRIKYLEQLFDYIKTHEKVVWMTASEIGDWYTAQMAIHDHKSNENPT
jgi:allantoinase